MSQSHALLRAVRWLHLYLGIFIAPALLFFAFTGALQTFSLHETTQGSSYKPPAWLATLAQLHKKQTIEPPLRRPRHDHGFEQSGGPGSRDYHDAGPSPQTSAQVPKPKPHLPMKIFFLVVSIGLFLSTVTGIYMSYRYMRNRWIVTILLVAGAVIPLLLLPF